MSPLLFALLLTASAAPAQRTEGRVIQTTSARAYLDAGADDGLTAGGEVVFHRAGKEVATCKLQEVAARASSCTVAGVHPGDTFDLPERPAQAVSEALPPPAAREVLAAQAKRVAAAPIVRVTYAGTPRAVEARRAPLASAELSEVAWVTTSASPFAGTRAAVAVHSGELGLGLRLDLDAQATRWTARPNPRFRPDDASQLYVWQAGLSRDPGRDGAAFAVGRLMPWRIPGATILDGATAGWRLPGLEVGAFGGLVAHPSTLAVAADRVTGGVYWVWDHAFAKGVSLREEGRVAMVRSPELGTRLEAETRAAARLGRALDLTGSVRLGVGGDVQAPGRIDGARLELSTRPVAHLRLAAWLAYDGLEVPVDAEPMVYPGRSRRAEASGSWDAGPGLRLTLLAGAAADLASKLDRQWVGPMLDLPRLLFGRGGLSLGYLEELGWSEGRSAWLQVVGRPWPRLRLLARVTWSHASALAVMQDEFGLALAAAADLTNSFSARFSVSSRGSFGLGEGASAEGGSTILGTVAARY